MIYLHVALVWGWQKDWLGGVVSQNLASLSSSQLSSVLITVNHSIQQYPTTHMLPRQNSLSHPKKPSLLRRSNTVTSTSPTKSEMLGPTEKKQQAVAAAQRAFGDDAVRRIHGSQSSSNMRPRLSEMNLNQLHLNRRPSARRPVARSTTVASVADSSQYDADYDSRASSIVSGDNRCRRFDNESTTANGYEATVARRRESMRWHREHLTLARSEQREHSAVNPEITYISREYPPSPPGSTPSSYRRIRKAKSAFAVSQIFQPSGPDVSSVVFCGEPSPEKKPSGRKSMSFLRGGTEFMGEGRARERRSYYMESAHRKFCPPIVSPEASGKYKGKNDKGEWGAMRFSVKKKARKITDSVFCSMKRVLGRACSNDKSPFGVIPEQHVPSSRMHFRDYVTPEEACGNNFSAPGKFGSKEKPVKQKIRSNYVISKAPTLHLVSSCEMIRSDVGSVRDATPPGSVGGDRKFSAASMGTTSTGTWNSTIASRMTRCTQRDGIPEEGKTDSVFDGNDEECFNLSPRRERYNVDARRVYSALIKRLQPEESLPSTQEPGYYMTPGIGLLPEEEGVFEKHSNTFSRNGSVRSNCSKTTVKPPALEPNQCEFEPGYPPPPVPKIPTMWLESESARTSNIGNTKRHHQGHIENNRHQSDSVQSIVQASEGPALPVTPPRQKGKRLPKPEFPNTVQPIRVESSVSIETFSTSTDGVLSTDFLQMPPSRRSTPRNFASSENLRRVLPINKRFSHLDAGEGIKRSRSVLEYRNPNTNSPMERTKTLGYDRPLSQNLLFRAGLRNMDLNAKAPIAGSDDPHLVISRKESRASLSGRVSRLSMKECDVGLAVARQFGPVIGQPVDAERNYGYRRCDGSVYADDAAFL